MTTGPSTTLRSLEAQHYLDGVAARLADLPEEDRADLLDELAAHVDELVAEDDRPLAARLGSPAEYAAELRAAAGLPPVRSRGRAGGQLIARLRQVERRDDVRAARRFAETLRPAWWVLRAWVVLVLLTWYAHPHWLGSLIIAPDVGPDALSLALLVIAVVISVETGRRGDRPGRWGRRMVLALNVVAVLGLVPALVSLSDSSPRYVYVTPEKSEVVPSEGVYANGQQVWNLYAYDAAGRLLHDVRLYTQDGSPLALGLSPDGTRKPVVDARGRLVENAFPYRYVEPDGTVADPDAGPTVDAPVLVGVPAPSPAVPGASTAVPSASLSPSPSPSPTGGRR